MHQKRSEDKYKLNSVSFVRAALVELKNSDGKILCKENPG